MNLAQIQRVGQWAQQDLNRRRRANPVKYFFQDIGSEIGKVARDIKPVSNILAPAVGTLLQGVPKIGSFIAGPGEGIVRNIGQRLGLGKRRGGKKKSGGRTSKKSLKSGGKRKPGRMTSKKSVGSGKKSTGGKKKSGGKRRGGVRAVKSMRIMAPTTRMLRPMVVY